MIEISLLGRFAIRSGAALLPDLDWGKAGELLGWLLLHPNRLVAREELAAVLWPEGSPERIGKYYTQTLWRLRSRLETELGLAEEDLLTRNQKGIRCEPGPLVRVDVAGLEQVLALTKGLRGRDLSPALVTLVREATALYQGDLLPGWYMDWCVREREYYRRGYRDLLDKLMDWCEAQGDWETGFGYGMETLRQEPACERAHRRVMRFLALTGNRTAALRQYEQCQALLNAELGMAPTPLTRELARQIREGSFDGTLPATESGAFPQVAVTPEPGVPDRTAGPGRKPQSRVLAGHFG